ncbi:MAG: Glu-tRNA(Gln) amidotransferase subunit GatD [Nitrososphaeria archaeon]|nr:Glu-tRNA(Gln) amidotransferase subunit GatD [Nitrososphaeria archaeon]NIN52286.1 Glu-tRNA(Gln) amidotransferase subunit GatD [Nitrososphaeria archaeon]NIQ32764.1 Glu-tRNA(Gln) amidotransferase subunit GatD [Nitrososphaeria archaeon]
MKSELRGYVGRVRELLSSLNIKVGSEVEIETKGKKIRGALMPRHELADSKHIVIKLESGYNVGIRYTPDLKIRLLSHGEAQSATVPERPEKIEGLPRVSILGTGGTIASKVDYRTGAVRPAISAEELVEILPELREYAAVEPEVIMSIYSENLTVKDWIRIATEAADKIRRGTDGIVILHGTDTLGYTSAALSFALQNLPVPVVMTASQRSSDRPSSDAALNLISAVVAAAKAPFAEVAVVMHENPSDEVVVLHRGTRNRKNHTSRRDAFQTVDATPYGRVFKGSVEMFGDGYRIRDPERELNLNTRFDERVALIKFHPNFRPEIIDFLVDKDYRGLVFEGSGLGHLNSPCFPSIKRAVDQGIVICITSQCIWGRTNLRVYDNGRDLLKAGGFPLENMLPETAYVKLMWVLGQTDDSEEAKEMMLTDIAGEITKFSPPASQRGF